MLIFILHKKKKKNQSQAFPNCTQQIGMSSEMTNSAYLQFNPVQQLVSCCGLELGINSSDMGLRRAISAPVSVPEMFLDTSCFTVIPSNYTSKFIQLFSFFLLFCFGFFVFFFFLRFKLTLTCIFFFLFCLKQQLQPPAMWDTDLQTLLNVEFNQGRSTTTYPPQPFTGRDTKH